MTAIRHLGDVVAAAIRQADLPVADGLRNTEIATRLFVAPSTIKTHLAHVFAKLGVSTRAELAALTVRSAVIK